MDGNIDGNLAGVTLVAAEIVTGFVVVVVEVTILMLDSIWFQWPLELLYIYPHCPGSCCFKAHL